MQCIDGPQRLTALVDFVNDKFEVFGGIKASGLERTPSSMMRFFAKIAVHEFANRAELLRFYLDLTSSPA